MNTEKEKFCYPRVSDIISKQNSDEFRNVNLEVLGNACLRGEKVHEYCTSYLVGAWISEIEEDYQPYVDAFRVWVDQNVDECLFSTVRLYDHEKLFTGEFDLIVKLKDSKRVAMIDIKTSSAVSKSWPIQLAAYKHLCELNDYPSDLYFNLHLKKTKGPEFNEKTFMMDPATVKCKQIPYEDLTVYWEIFASALRCYDYFTRKEKKDVCV